MNSDTAAAEAALKAKLSRKRTKTGCLTCRKRRIKCGEERDVCKNCVKSKRHCEGFSQRLVFKPPTFEFRSFPHGGAHITFQAEPQPDPNMQAAQQFEQPHWGSGLQQQPAFPQAEPLARHASYPSEHGMVPNRYHGLAAVEQPMGFISDPNVQQPPYLQSNEHPRHEDLRGGPLSFPVSGPPNVQFEPILGPTSFGGASAVHKFEGHEFSRATEHDVQPGWQAFHPAATQAVVPPMPAFRSPASRRMSAQMPASRAVKEEDFSSMWRMNNYAPRPEYQRPIDYQPPTPPVHILNTAAVEVQDDDYYDVQSDGDMDIDTSVLVDTDLAPQRRLTRLMERHSISVQDSQLRRYDTFMYEGILDKYRTDDQANPLRNRATALVFAHFVAVTGPSLSIFERHMRNSSVLSSEGQIPFPQQGLWTYTLPLAALRHRGLLHAMLALASLHIARLQNASHTPSMQHYTWAVKRIRQCVGHPKKRLKITTIAASMLLGFYEIMTADHTKWNMHLAGSKQLFHEVDFSSMVRQFRQRKRERNFGFQSRYGRPDDELLDQMYDVDERLISELAGREVNYDQHGHVMTPQSSSSPELDLGKFAMMKDLWWWYCKQDVYQSIISGNPLLLDYNRWQNCPPRAPLGQADAVYGSVDHLILLLGRIADFAARDRLRKLKQMEANGGQWRPPGPPGMQPAHSTAGAAPPTPLSASNGFVPNAPAFPPPQGPGGNGPLEPLFFGMAPPPRENVQMPTSYMPNGMPPQGTASPKEIVDLQAATQAALQEHSDIRAALYKFESSLGETFQPLSPEYQQPLPTPFGDALFYRSYDIGCLWAIFYMATIITIRSAPHMHPAAHAAAAIAAKDTSWAAERIGRIVAGIVPGPPDQPLNPTLGATLCESCMPSFFAAIQYQDPSQRATTVAHMYNIEQRTGWGSIGLIANGCETSWVKAADAGRGPPYHRVARPKQSNDPRLNGSWERLDPNASPDETDDNDRRLVRTKPNARLNWAIGVMGTENDVV